MSAREPQFFYDFTSPYSYLAALRVDAVLPVRPAWRPISFGVIVARIGKVPWSFKEDRGSNLAELDRRAAARGIPRLRYPQGWPLETYSLTPLRAALLAQEVGLLREFSRELFRAIFVDGHPLTDMDAVIAAAGRAGMDASAVREGVQRQDVRDRLRAETEAALTLGVSGVPTVAIDGELFWGDDQLEAAAAAIAAG